MTAGINSSTKLQVVGFDKGSSIVGLLLADSKFSQLGELTVLLTSLYSKGLNSWRAEELENRTTMTRRANNDGSLKNKINPSIT